MNRRAVYAAVMIISSLFLVSCGQESPFLPVSSIGDAVSLGVSVPAGKVLDPGTQDSIDIDFSYDEASVIPDRLEVTLLDSRETPVGDTVVIEGDDLDSELPSIDTASLEDGLYYIRLRVYDSSDQLIKESVTPFFDSRITVNIKGIDVYPPEFSPASSGFLFPDVDAPDTSWIRWSLGSSIISEGTLESYKSGLVWTAPEAEGVYSLKMEVFPFAPVSGSYDFPSSMYTDVQIFVTDSVTGDKFDLGPGEEYTVLLNLNGNLNNEGEMSADAVFSGNPVPDLEDSGFGYRISPPDGIVIDRDVLPSEEGVLAPFTAVMRLKVEDSSFGTGILRISGPAGGILNLGVDETGIFYCRIRQRGDWIYSLSGIHVLDSSEIAVSVVPSDNEITFLWYADGILKGVSVSDYRPLEIDGNNEGESIIGGDGGFKGFVDYFGIHSGLDDNIFRRLTDRTAGDGTVVLAEGFDGLSVPEYISRLNREDDSLSVKDGNLVIPPLSEAVMFESPLDFDGFVLEAGTLGGESGGYYTFTLYDPEVQDSAGTAVRYPVAGSPVTAVLDRSGGRLVIGGDDDGKVFLPFTGNEYLRIGIQNSDSERTYMIASFLIKRKGGKVVENKAAVFGNNL